MKIIILILLSISSLMSQINFSGKDPDVYFEPTFEIEAKNMIDTITGTYYLDVLTSIPIYRLKVLPILGKDYQFNYSLHIGIENDSGLVVSEYKEQVNSVISILSNESEVNQKSLILFKFYIPPGDYDPDNDDPDDPEHMSCPGSMAWVV